MEDMTPTNDPHEYDETNLRRKDKSELIALLQDTLKKRQELKETTETQAQELAEMMRDIDENVTTNWSWDRIRKKFKEYDDVNEALDFLVKIIEEKSICTNNKCPVFPAQNEISRELLTLEREYERVYDPDMARKRFSKDAVKLERWKKRYWKIRYKENNLLDAIIQIGLPNRTQKDTLFEMQDRYHDQDIDLVDHLGEGHNVNVNFHLNEASDIRRRAEANLMTAQDFQNGDIKHWLNEKKKRIRIEQEKKKNKKSKRNDQDEDYS